MQVPKDSPVNDPSFKSQDTSVTPQSRLNPSTVRQKTQDQRGNIPLPEESSTAKMSFKEKIINYFSKPPEFSNAREGINMILFPYEKIDPGTRISDAQLKQAEIEVKKSPAALSALKRYIDDRNQEIANGGLIRKISHLASTLWGTSLTAKAEKIYQSATQPTNTMPEVDYSRGLVGPTRSTNRILEVDYSRGVVSDTVRKNIPYNTVSEIPLEMSIGNSKIVSFTGFLAKTDPSQPGKGVPEGMGLAKLADGRECYGNFKNGKFIQGEIHDRGTLSYGKFEDGLLMGKGIIKFSNGVTMHANFEKGQLIGDTKTLHSGGASLEVKFKDGVDISGRFKGADGTEMAVSYKNGKMTSESSDAINRIPIPQSETRQHPNGNIETGSFTNGKLHGKGEVIMAGGEELSGTFINGVISGRAVLKLSNETIYANAFNGKLEGFCRVVDNEGKSSLAFIKEGKKVPIEEAYPSTPAEQKPSAGSNYYKGLLSLPDQYGIIPIEEVYPSTPAEQKPSAGSNYYKGILSVPDQYGIIRQVEYEGNIQNGLPEGRGKLRQQINETAFQLEVGNFVEGKLVHGRMEVYYDTNSKPQAVIEGEFQNGVLHGKGKTTYLDGRVYEGRYEEGYYRGPE